MPPSASQTTDATPAFFSEQVSAARRFYLDLARSDAGRLAVVCGGCEQCALDYAIDRATFPYQSIEFVAQGRGTLRLGGQTVKLLPGVAFSYGPGVAQHITSDAAHPLVKYFVDFTGRGAGALLRGHGLAAGTAVHVMGVGEVESVFDALIRDGLKGSSLSPALCVALLEYLVLKISESRVPGTTGETPAFSTYQRCRQHIVEHCHRLMSLEEIANECHLDRAYLCRLFRRFDHQTPHQFLMRRKMNLAAERLQHSDVLVKQVAARLGFRDPFHFSRAFKRVFGLSPEAFRRQPR